MSKELEFVEDAKAEGCRGGHAPTGVDPCCVADAEAKSAGDDGCGCGTPAADSVKKSVSSC